MLGLSTLIEFAEKSDYKDVGNLLKQCVGLTWVSMGHGEAEKAILKVRDGATKMAIDGNERIKECLHKALILAGNIQSKVAVETDLERKAKKGPCGRTWR